MQAPINQERDYSIVIIRDLETSPYIKDINDFLNRSGFSYHRQSPMWALCDNGGINYFIVLTLKNDQINAYSLVREKRYRLIGRSKYFVDGGPVTHSPCALTVHLRHLLDTLESSGVWVRINPYIMDQDIKMSSEILRNLNFRSMSRDSRMYTATVVINLGQSLNEVKSGFRRSLRTQLNKSERSGLIATQDTTDRDFHEFLRDYNQQAENKRLEYISPDRGLMIYKYFLKDGRKGCFIKVSMDGEILGGLVLLGSGNRVIYEWGYSSSRPEHRKLPLGHILQWRAIKWAKENGFSIYDFGGYREDRGDNDSNNRFKTGFSKNIQHVLPEHIYTFSYAFSFLFDFASGIKRSLYKV